MAAHTPGPWTWHQNPDDTAFVEAGGHDNLYAEVWVMMDAGTTAADARLIAAAPDLLAALKTIRDAADGHLAALYDGQEYLRRADAAIAKAEGRLSPQHSVEGTGRPL